MKLLAPTPNTEISEKLSLVASIPGATTTAAVLHAPCIFCDVRAEKGFDILLETDEFVVFRDIRPACAHHLQVVPKKHIDNVRSLSAEHVGLISRMRDAGHEVLDALGVPSAPGSRRLGFHIPPYISIGHLHLHVQALPYRSTFGGWRYPVRRGGAGKSKGWSMFSEVSQTLEILQRGGKVRIGPC
ncbi:HIT-like protein [Auricularia subglabra TFB-10046 SS5]|nr:HIT-like protein [Auricularia subglabra TFB-10046 SS5]